MKKVLMLALSLAAAGYTAQAQAVKPANAVDKPAGPQIQFDEVKYDFGSVTQGGIVDHVFKFKNVGTQPLVISNIGVSCGCTTPDWTKEPIGPGKTGTISAKFNSTGKMGMQNKVLTIESNSVGGSTTVALVGEVKETGATAPAAATAMPADKAPGAAAEAGKVKAKEGDLKVKAKTKKG